MSILQCTPQRVGTTALHFYCVWNPWRSDFPHGGRICLGCTSAIGDTCVLAAPHRHQFLCRPVLSSLSIEMQKYSLPKHRLTSVAKGKKNSYSAKCGWTYRSSKHTKMVFNWNSKHSGLRTAVGRKRRRENTRNSLCSYQVMKATGNFFEFLFSWPICHFLKGGLKSKNKAARANMLLR